MIALPVQQVGLATTVIRVHRDFLATRLYHAHSAIVTLATATAMSSERRHLMRPCAPEQPERAAHRLTAPILAIVLVSAAQGSNRLGGPR